MEKRIIYSTEVTVSNMVLEEEREMKVEEVYLQGIIWRCSQRKLFGIIPLSDKYEYKVYPHIFVRNKYTGGVHATVPSLLSFESRKRLMEEQQNLEAWLRNKCNEYKKEYGKSR